MLSKSRCAQWSPQMSSSLSSIVSEDDLGPNEYKNVYRSQDMTFVRVILNDQNKVPALRTLGKMEVYHLVNAHADADSNPDNMEFKRRIQDCSALLRQISTIETDMKLFGITAPIRDHAPDLPEGDVCALAGEWLAPLEMEISQHSQFLHQITSDMVKQYEYQQVLQLALELTNSTAPSTVVSRRNVGSVQSTYSDDELHGFADAIPLVSLTQGRPSVDDSVAAGVVHIYGVIPQTMKTVFTNTVTRISRGNVYMTWRENTSTPIVTVSNKAEISHLSPEITVVPSYAFSLKLPPGTQLYQRILRLCSVIGAHVYDVPVTNNPRDIETIYARVTSEAARQIEARRHTTTALRRVYERATNTSSESQAALMQESGVPSFLLSDWRALLEQEQHVTHALSTANRAMRGSSSVCVLQGWIPTHRLACVEAAFSQCVQGTDILPPLMQIPNDGKLAEDARPPTRFDTTPLWAPFQQLVDTYGVPAYKEANPGLFTTITFPFLFGVMFGDVFHGAVLSLVGLVGLLIANRTYNVKYEDKEEEEGPYAHESIPKGEKMNVGMWIMLFLMGMFALYAGFIYNDCASVPLAMGTSGLVDKNYKLLPPDQRSPYGFGIDYAYYHTPQELPFLNSFKMKMSVIMGVIHMTFGLFIGVSNHLYRRKTHLLWLESLPRILLMLSTFGYMIMIIMYKWTVDWHQRNQSPPSLIQTMIAMFLSPGSVAPGDTLFSGQALLQASLLIIAGLCVPLIFFGEPIYNYLKWRSLHSGRYDEQGGPVEPLTAHTSSSSYSTFPQSPMFPAVSDPNSATVPAVALFNDRMGDLLEDEEELSAEGEGQSLLSSRHNRSRDLTPTSSDYTASDAPVVVKKAAEKDHSTDPRDLHYSFSSDLIHHSIHAIEFVLGTVSNTASYLRLWALSLAHAQLAQVFWNKILVDYGLKISPLATVVAMAVWTCATVGVLLCMDALECFLHALRLHWVEFNSKFYVGNGYAFTPFSVRVGQKTE